MVTPFREHSINSKSRTSHIKSHSFVLFDTISTIRFPCNLKLACHVNSTHKTAANWLSDFFVKLTFPVLNTQLASKRKSQTKTTTTEKTTKLTTYSKVVNYRLRTYATDNNKADKEGEIMMYTQPPKKNSWQFAEALVGKAFRHGDVYEEDDLNEIFLKRLNMSMRKSVRGYWATHQSASPQDLEFHGTTLLAISLSVPLTFLKALKLQRGRHGSANSQVGEKLRNRRTI